MRAPRTWIIPEADTVFGVEGNTALSELASLILSGGVCGAGMHEMAQSRNLGDPESSPRGSDRQRTEVYGEDTQEVSPLHSTGETG